jgi:hypothetical protein
MAAAPRSSLGTAYLAVNALIAVLILIQAALAGQALFVADTGWPGSTEITIHGIIGNVTFTIGFAACVLAFLAKVGKGLLTANAVLLLALFAQTGLGYVGRETMGAASIHVPLGVTSFGLAVAIAVVAAVRGRAVHSPA